MPTTDRSYTTRYARQIGINRLQFHTNNPDARIEGQTTATSVITNMRSAAGPLIVDGQVVKPCCEAPIKTFVLACIDPRYTDALEKYLLQTLGERTYDLFILAGASLGGNLTGNSDPCPTFTAGKCTIVSATNNWQQTLLDHIQVAITLHNVTEFIIIDHLDCGAYSACTCISTDLNAANHETQFNTLAAFINNSVFFSNSGTPSTLGSSIFTDIYGYYFDFTGTNSIHLIDYNGRMVTTEPLPAVPDGRTKVLVLGCIDPRFISQITNYLVNSPEINAINNNYDLFMLAGASLGVNQSYNTVNFPTVHPYGDPSTTDYPNNLLANGVAGIGKLGTTWGPTFFDHLAVAIALHGITDVWVYDHLDCGAYTFIKLSSPTAPAKTDDNISEHTEELLKLRGYITGNNPSLGFKGYVVDLEGNFNLVVPS